MRIVIITLGTYPLQTGGVQLHSYYHAKALAQAGNDVTVFAKRSKGAPRSLKDGRVDVELLGSSVPVLGVLLFVLDAFVRLARGRGSIDMVHVHYATYFMLPAFLFHLFTSKPFVVTCHGFDIVYLRKSAGWKMVQKMVLMKAAMVTCTSTQVHDLLLRDYGLDPRRVRTIHNGFDESDIARARAGRTSRRGNRVAFVANLRPVKDPYTAIEAVRLASKSVAGLTLTVIGGGPMLGELQQFVRGNHLEEVVYLRGELDHPQTLQTVAGCDVFVLSSLSEGGNPLALIEAMALEVPVVATNAGGVNDLVKDGVSGLLVPVRSPGAMAEGIVRILLDPILSVDLASNAAQVAMAYTWTGAVSAYLEIYGAIVGR